MARGSEMKGLDQGWRVRHSQQGETARRDARVGEGGSVKGKGRPSSTRYLFAGV